MNSQPHEPIRLLGPTWTESDSTKLDNLSTAYLNLRAHCNTLAAENERLDRWHVWREFWAFVFGCGAMLIVVIVMAGVGR